MALTATASATTQSAIFEALKLFEPVVVSMDLNRHNIFLSVGAIRTMCVSNRNRRLTVNYLLHCVERLGRHCSHA